MTLYELFDEAVRQAASDIHLADGETPWLRVAGDLVPVDLVPVDGAIPPLRELLQPLLTPEGLARLGAGLTVEKTIVHGELAFVGIVFRVGEGNLAATFRILQKTIPPLDFIAQGALPLFEKLIKTTRGLILVVGPTGSGKWTVGWSMVDAINEVKGARIFVLENHPSFHYASKKSLVTALHVGHDCESYESALSTILQADLDVVAMDDIPTFEALRRALTLADTGHLVIANLHASSPADAVERLVASAGSEADALRRSLAQNLVAVTAQRLLPGKEKGRVAAYEYVVNTPAVRAALISGDDLAEVQASDPECRTLNGALDEMVAAGRVTEEVAAAHRE